MSTEKKDVHPDLKKHFEQKKKQEEAAKVASKHPGIITSTSEKKVSNFFINSNNQL